ncbi:uncharacterized protein LOC113759597 [Coffea eugenioides]|uniref:uncharacterized protein LOC113759597 n=1 Tax=Coffea eugenioides TaxID=49369 RepID=UPI000F615CF7|nr:uncharacterized protein LOC113759597 [Coffea eugenioides]
MEEELVEVLQKFALSEKEVGSTLLDLGDLDEGIIECQGSIIGKIRGEKIANFTGVKNFATLAWSYPKGLRVAELGPNVFQFTIPDAKERERILEGGPWIIDNQILVLRNWEVGIEEDEDAFSVAPIWVQVWNLPIHCLSKAVGKKVGTIFHEVKEVLIPQSGGKEGKHMKLLVLIDIKQPLLRGTTIQMNGVNKWLSFKYERCPDFCYSCGVIGHSEKNCKFPVVVKKGQYQNQYGPWMRVFGGRGSPQKDSSQKIWMPHKQVWKVRNGKMIRLEDLEKQEKGVGLNENMDLSRTKEVRGREIQNHEVEKGGLPPADREKVGRIIPN